MQYAIPSVLTLSATRPTNANRRGGLIRGGVTDPRNFCFAAGNTDQHVGI